MVSFTDMVGGETGELLDYYFIYIFLLLIFGIVYYVGLFQLLYKMVQQIFILLTMSSIAVLWWMLVNRHLKFMQEVPASKMKTQTLQDIWINKGFGASSAENVLKGVMDDPLLIGPLSEVILITGTTIMILSWLYLQLPIDLIPDCIPCIGKYDNMLAKLWLGIGFLISGIGVYLQLYYVTQPNSTLLIYDYFSNFTQNFRAFLKKPTEKQVTTLKSLFTDIMASVVKFSQMVSASFVVVFQKLQGIFNNQGGKGEL